MRGFPAGNKLGVANMIGVSAYVRDVNLEIPSLDYPEIPADLHYGGLTWTQDILLVAKPGFEIVINTDSPKVLPPLNEDKGISGFIPAPNPPFIVPGRDKHKSKELRAREKHEVGDNFTNDANIFKLDMLAYKKTILQLNIFTEYKYFLVDI